ncbi:MAG: RIP metalloprotease RseP [Thermoclostridium sp.]|nr:RIP metalloprotease RseP [Thermoclostridium sp.]
MNILLAIVALSFLILIHELGHFIVARWAGVKVLEFAIFMGPKLFSWKRGETEYSIRAIPMGGFCKMEGEEEASNDERSFSKKPAGKRALIIVAGAAMNILVAVIITTFISFSMGYNTRTIENVDEGSPLIEAGLQVGDEIVSYDRKHIFFPSNDFFLFLFLSDGEEVEVAYRRPGVKGLQRTTVTPEMSTPMYMIGITVGVDADGTANSKIEKVQRNSPADIAKMLPGDRIVRVDDAPVAVKSDLFSYLQQSKENPVDITVDRNGEIITLYGVKPQPSETYYDLGVQFEYKKGDFFGTIQSGLNYSISTIRSVYMTLGGLFTGKVKFQDVSGPVGIVDTIGQVVDAGTGFSGKLLNLLQITMFLSLNLGVMNLLPFPALDGGKLLLILIEKIRRKPIDPEKEAWISMVGFILLILLLIATLFNDIPRIFRG